MTSDPDGRRIVEVVLPQLGESVAEGTVTSWRKATGERVDEDEPLCEVSTDKVNTDIPSPASGEIAELVVGEGETVEVGAVLARIAVSGGRAEGGERADAGGAGGRARATAEEGRPHFEDSSIDLWGGSGEAGGGAPEVGSGAAGEAAAASGPGAGREGGGGRREELSPVRRVIAERLSESKATIPHSTTVMEADLAEVARIRERERAGFEEREGVPLTYLPFVAFAALRAMEEHPKMNAVFEGDAIRYRPDVNLGVAVATDRGLLVPVVREADGLSFPELAKAMRAAAAGARSSTLEPADVQGGTFTVTNHGRGGSLLGTPIIVPGQTGVLGVGEVRDVPAAVDGEVTVRTRCYLSLSFDHRTVDGAEADAFLGAVVERLESFDGEPLRG